MSHLVTPFRLRVPEAELRDLRDRLTRTRWPEKETVDDWSQGVPLAYLRELCRYWAEKYDWRATERRLNALPQFRTAIDGLGIHFVHVRSPHEGALPLVLTHGWPGSVVEFLKVIGPLTDPAAHGGDAAAAFHVVCPSLPGYGFSDKPAGTGWGVERIAAAWIQIMARLGYDRYGAQGGDWGTSITTRIGQQDPEHVAGIHLMPPLAAPDPATMDDLTDARTGHAGRAGAGAGVGGRLLAGAVHQAADHRLRPRRLPIAAVRVDRGEVPLLDGLRRAPGERRSPATSCWTTSCSTGCRAPARRPPGCTGRASSRSSGASRARRPTW